MKEVLEKMLQIDPRLRWPIWKVTDLPYWRPPEAEVCLSQVSAERGSFTMVSWQPDPTVLHWLQADPCWDGIAEKIGQPQKKRAKVCMSPSEQVWT